MNHDLLYVKDIADAMAKIEKCIANITEDVFLKNDEKQALVIFNLQIIGEAVGKLSKEIKKKYPGINWIKLRSMRNMIVHEYFNIKPKSILYTAKNDLPGIHKQILAIEKELK